MNCKLMSERVMKSQERVRGARAIILKPGAECLRRHTSVYSTDRRHLAHLVVQTAPAAARTPQPCYHSKYISHFESCSVKLDRAAEPRNELAQ